MTQNFVRVPTDKEKSDFLRYKDMEITKGVEPFVITTFKGYH